MLFRSQPVLYDEVDMVPLVYPVYLNAANKRVKGFVPSPFALNDFRKVRIDP